MPSSSAKDWVEVGSLQSLSVFGMVWRRFGWFRSCGSESSIIHGELIKSGLFLWYDAVQKCTCGDPLCE